MRGTNRIVYLVKISLLTTKKEKEPHSQLATTPPLISPTARTAFSKSKRVYIIPPKPEQKKNIRRLFLQQGTHKKKKKLN